MTSAPRLQAFRFAALALLCAAGTASADPWQSPGDLGLRHDLELLADAGILHGPVTTWPVSWPDISRDVRGASLDGLDAGTLAALHRVQRRAAAASDPGFSGIGLRASAAHGLTPLRGFADAPREEGELGANIGWLSDHVVANLTATVAVDPEEGRKVRADGSYLAVNVGNVSFSAGYIDRWWGPGWDGSLILSTNARPMPALSIERNYSDPFKSRWLSWIGPWRATVSMGESEGDDLAVPNVRFFAARVNFKPRPWMEFGLSRTAQWCGEGRPCGWHALTDLLLGRDNQVANGSFETQPGNQMAGYDLRLRSPWRALPVAFYTQWIGEDEAGGLPSKFMGLFGLSAWGGGEYGSWRVRAEYADTTCIFTSSTPEFGCGYRNALYPQGYTNRHRVIGHSMDNDSRMTTLAALWTRPDGDLLALTWRNIDLNRDGGPHAISDVPLKINDVELSYSRSFAIGTVRVVAGHGDGDVRGFLTWQQGM